MFAVNGEVSRVYMRKRPGLVSTESTDCLSSQSRSLKVGCCWLVLVGCRVAGTDTEFLKRGGPSVISPPQELNFYMNYGTSKLTSIISY